MAIRGHPRSRMGSLETPSDLGEYALNCTDVVPAVTVRIPPRPRQISVEGVLVEVLRIVPGPVPGPE